MKSGRQLMQELYPNATIGQALEVERKRAQHLRDVERLIKPMQKAPTTAVYHYAHGDYPRPLRAAAITVLRERNFT